jgi:hypothetical protein
MVSSISAGRGRLPVWVVRICVLVLRFMLIKRLHSFGC